MKFNKITRGAKRAVYDEQTVFEILDDGFVCHLSCIFNDVPVIIPTAYGRENDCIYLHGSSKNAMLLQAVKAESICLAVTHTDGIVLARNLFHSSVNYRSVVLFGKAELVSDFVEKSHALRVICDNITKGRVDEVPLGSDQDIENTLVIRMKIDSASAKVRAGHPAGDDDEVPMAWSGVVPLRMVCDEPIRDPKFTEVFPESNSLQWLREKYK